MSSDTTDNPFAALLTPISDIQQSQNFTAKATKVTDGVDTAIVNTEIKPSADNDSVSAANQLQISYGIERVFLITLDKEPGGPKRPARCVFLDDLYAGLKQEWLDLDCLGTAVCDRIMLPDPGNYVINTHGTTQNIQAASAAGESEVIRYLAQCYVRLQNERKDPAMETLCTKCDQVIRTNSLLAMRQPIMFEGLDPAKQFMDMYMDELNSKDFHIICEFFSEVAIEIDVAEFEGPNLYDIYKPVFDEILQKFQNEFTLGHGTVYRYIDLLEFFTKKICLANAFLTHNVPQNYKNGPAYEKTILGSILSLSCVVKNERGPYEFFDKPSRSPKQEHDITESNLQQQLSLLNERVYQLISNILKLGSDPKERMCDWIGNCLHYNVGRAKLWSNQLPAIFGTMHASDGFFLNLCNVLLRLSIPFSEPCSAKLLKVQPTYCLATTGDRQKAKQRRVHMIDIAEETMLVPPPDGENERLKPEENYNFISECFFMTHYGLHLGFHVLHEKFMKLNQDLNRIQSVYQDIRNQGGENTEPGQRVKEQMEKGMTLFLSMKAALTEPQLLEACFKFHIASASYLCHMATSGDRTQFSPVKFPLPTEVPVCMSTLPEFIMENILDFLLFVRRFKDTMYEVVGDRLQHIMTLVLTFMGSPDRTRNPHLRARLAEALESLMPPKDSRQSTLALSSFHRQQLFHNHPLVENLAPTLLHVFVSIEMTGQGVEFEQKFNYRRPMYTVLEYIWEIEIHRKAIKEMAAHAEIHIEDTDAPLFLRFINLLINDAIFLLDEALSYMIQIKEKQEEKDSGAWAELTDNQRQENEMNLRQVGMLARFHNIMGNDTIHSIEMLCREIQSLFCRDLIADRVAAMLNYFLLHLVGPKKKNLKVKDFDKYDFKPQEVVSHICQIYLNLGDDEQFCIAVSNDGRSYSDDLFHQAERVLQRIGKPMTMISQFAEVSAKIKTLATQQKLEEEALLDAPEEFLDPIMGTLMKEPVTLPASGQIVDKATIARHLLSDQSDPFNRQSLSMDMVQPNVELKQKIQKWKAESKKK